MPLFRNQAEAADDPAAGAYRQADEGPHARGDGCSVSVLSRYSGDVCDITP